MEELYTIIEVDNFLQYGAIKEILGIGMGIVSIINGIGQKRKAKKAYEEAEEDAAIAKEEYLSYAERFDSPVQPGSTRTIARSLEQDPSLMLGGNSPFSKLPGFSQYPFKVEDTPDDNVSEEEQKKMGGASSGASSAGATNYGKNRAVLAEYDKAGNITNMAEILQAMQTIYSSQFNNPNQLGAASNPLLNDLNPAEIQASLDMFNILGNGKLDVPYWELEANFDRIAKKTNYKSTNPDSEYFDEEAEFTGTQTEDVERDAEGNVIPDFDNLFTEEFLEQVNTEEYKTAVEESMKKLQEPYTDEDGNVNTEKFVEAVTSGEALVEAGIVDENGNVIDQETGKILDVNINNLFTQTGATGTTGGSTPGFADSIKALQREQLGGQLYEDSEIQNPYGRFRDKSGIIQDRSDLFTEDRDRTTLLRDRSGMIVDTSERLTDLRRGAQDFSGLATDTSTLASNTFANLQVATQAADLQAQQSDQALANTLSTIRATGAGAGGATAIAQAALQSKLGVSATIEQQESRNTQLRAQGQQQIETIRMSESKRLQDIAFSERLRLDSLREREGLRLDQVRQEQSRRLQDVGFGEARRIDDVSFQESGRIQQAELSEAIRKQNIQLAEQQALRQADVTGVQYQQGIAFDMAQRNLDRLSGIATQSMVNQQAARASQAATSGAVTGGLFQLAGTLGAAAIKGD
jgi:hypothetical protein